MKALPLTKQLSGFGQYQQFASLLILPVLLSGWLYVRGVSATHSIALSTVISIQIFTGACCWHLLNRGSTVSTPEYLGMGTAIGSALATASDQILLHTQLSQIAWIIPSGLISMMILWRVRLTSTEFVTSHDFSWLFIILGSIILGNGKLIYGYGYALLMLASGFYYSRNRQPHLQFSIFLISSFLGFVSLRLFRPFIEYGSFRMRPLYTGTDDLVFSESLSTSISHFGLRDYGAAVGSPIRYHWFSLAWSGLTSRISGSAPFDVTLHVVPYIAFLGVSCLVWAIVFRLTTSTATSTIAVLVVFATDSLPEGLRFFFVSNTSNTLSQVWLLSAILVIYCAIESRYKQWLVVVPLVISVVFLAKSPSGVVVLSAMLLSMLFFCVIYPKKWLFAVSLTFLSYFLAMATYFLFLKPNDWEQRSFELNFDPFRLGVVSSRNSFITVLLIISIYVSRFPFSLAIFRSPQRPILRVYYIFLGVGAGAGLARFVLNGGSAEQYFLNSALLFGAVLTSSSIHISINSATDICKKYFTLLYFLSTTISVLLFKFALDESHISRFTLGNKLQILLTPIVAIVIATLSISFARWRHGKKPRYIQLTFVVALIGVSTGIFALRSLAPDTYNFTESVASTTDLVALDWVRSNVDEFDILATNRFLCNQDTSCDYDDSSFLISAVSGRRVLIEGPRFVVGGRPYPDWVRDRISLSVSFANAPTDALFVKLQNFNVRWFYLDTHFINSGIDPLTNPWERWANVVFQNSNIYVLRLKY